MEACRVSFITMTLLKKGVPQEKNSWHTLFKI